MLIEFSVSNYRSFKDVATFSMVATSLKAKNKSLDAENVFAVDDDLRLLKSAAIYGANASGKSNLIAAFKAMRKFIYLSPMSLFEDEPSLNFDYDPFLLDSNSKTDPTRFQIVLQIEGKQYRYGFSITQDEVTSEWLYHVPNVRESKLFVREGQHFKISKAFQEGEKVVEQIHKTSLLLTVAAIFNGKISSSILHRLDDFTIISSTQDKSVLQKTLGDIDNAYKKEDLLNFTKKLDLGIVDIRLDKTKILDKEKKSTNERIDNVYTVHSWYNYKKKKHQKIQFDLGRHESEGTQKAIALSGPIITALMNGQVLIVDELDSSLHPLITRKIIQAFNSSEVNPRNAQLIFTTHDINLLDNSLLRRDQIWFTEKGRDGATQLYSLAEFKVRNDASFEKDYIQGRYGAIPFLGDLNHTSGERDG